MSKITIANMPEVQRTEKAGMLDPSSATAPYRALQGVAQGISDVSEFGLKKLKLNENSAMADQDLFQMSIEDEVATDMPKLHGNNHEEWVGYVKEKTSARGKQLAEDIKGLDIRPAVKAQMLQAHEKWAQGLVGEWELKASARDFELKATSIKLQAQSYYDNGLYEAGGEVLKGIGMSEKEFKILDEEMKIKGDLNLADKFLLEATQGGIEDVQEFISTLGEKGSKGDYKFLQYLEDDDRMAFIAKAERTLSGMQADFYDELALGVAEGKYETPAKIKEWKESGRLSAGQASQYISNYHSVKSGKPEFNPGEYSQLMVDISNYDPDADPDKKAYGELMARILGMPSGATSELRGLLKGRHEKTEDSTVVSSVISTLGRMNSKNFFNDGDVPDDPEEMLKAETLHVQMQRQARDLAKKNPDLTESQIMEILFAPGGAGEEATAKKAEFIKRGTGRSYTPAPEAGKAFAGDAVFNYLSKQFPGLELGMSFKEAVKVITRPDGTVDPQALRALKSFYGIK